MIPVSPIFPNFQSPEPLPLLAYECISKERGRSQAGDQSKKKDTVFVIKTLLTLCLWRSDSNCTERNWFCSGFFKRVVNFLQERPASNAQLSLAFPLLYSKSREARHRADFWQQETLVITPWVPQKALPPCSYFPLSPVESITHADSSMRCLLLSS